MLTVPVVANGVDSDEFFADGDLHGGADDCHLDLTTAELGAHSVVGARKGDVAGAVDLAGYRSRRDSGSRCQGFGEPWLAPALRSSLLRSIVPGGMGGNQDSAVVDVQQSVVTGWRWSDGPRLGYVR